MRRHLNRLGSGAAARWRVNALVPNIDGIYLKRSWSAGYENVAVMIAAGDNEGGHREIIGCAEVLAESKAACKEFLPWLKSRGSKGVRMLTGDKSPWIAQNHPRSGKLRDVDGEERGSCGRSLSRRALGADVGGGEV